MPRLIATYRWELLIVVGLVGSYAAIWTVLSVSGVPTDAAAAGAAALMGLRAVLMGALYFRLRRLGYGLEFALLAAVPFTAGLASLGYLLAFPVELLGSENPISLLFLRPLIEPLTTAILLSVLYGYVRRAQGGFLGLVCGLMLAAAAAESAIVAHEIAPSFMIPNLYVTAAFLFGGALYAWRLRLGFTRPVWAAAFAAVLVHLVFTAALDRASLFIFFYRTPGAFIIEFSTMLLALWFARRASRVSLAHAFFIVALIFSFPFVGLFEIVAFQSDAETPLLRVLASPVASRVLGALGISATLAAVWMLGNFDRLDAAFRKRAAAALFGIRAAVGIAGAVILAARSNWAFAQDAPLEALVIVGWGATIALVYLLRDRRAAISVRDAAPPGGA